MADYICTYRTNYFRVTDEEKYQKLINKLAGEDLEIFDDENSNGMHGFGGTGSMSYCSAQTVAEWMNEPTHDRPVKFYEETEWGSGVWTQIADPEEAEREELYIVEATEKDSGYEIRICRDKEDLAEDSNGMDTFYKELQQILPNGEAMILQEAGHEKLNYVAGIATIITNKEIRFLDLSKLAVKTAGDMLGTDFQTQMDY